MGWAETAAVAGRAMGSLEPHEPKWVEGSGSSRESVSRLPGAAGIRRGWPSTERFPPLSHRLEGDCCVAVTKGGVTQTYRISCAVLRAKVRRLSPSINDTYICLMFIFSWMIIALLNWEVAEVLVSVSHAQHRHPFKRMRTSLAAALSRAALQRPVRQARVLRGECYGDGACWQRAAQLVGFPDHRRYGHEGVLTR